jgi:hypothetical protein
MTDYAPESLTEAIIAHGAQDKALDPELREIAEIIVSEAAELRDVEDREVREYMLLGTALVQEVLEKHGA